MERGRSVILARLPQRLTGTIGIRRGLIKSNIEVRGCLVVLQAAEAALW
jgi:hypothetical protein